MIRRAALVVAALVAFPSPASAGPAFDKAVAATLINNCLDYQVLTPVPVLNCATNMLGHYNAALNPVKAAALADWGSDSWWNVIRKLGLPDIGLSDGSILPGGGGWGGGGSHYGWDPDADYCAAFRNKLSTQGTLIVPAIELPGGGPMQVGPHPDPMYKSTFGQSDITHGGGSGYDMADTGKALALWALHHRNRKWTSDFADPAPKGWQGCYSLTDNGCKVSSVPYIDHHGHHTMADGQVNYTNGNGFYTNSSTNNKSCPEGGFGGGDIHFYLWGAALNGMNTCTWYIPNRAIAPSGYYYPTEVALPAAEMNSFPGGMPNALAACNMSEDLIRRVAEEIRKKAELAGAPPTKPITEAKTGGTQPTLEDLKDTANLDGAGTPTDPTPAPQQPGGGTPSTGFQDECDFGPGGCDNPNTAEPTLGETPTGIMDPIFDWLPDLPSITFPDTGAPGCPVWNIDLRDYEPTWQFLMDSHCDVAEAGREAISALMIALFGVGAALIILRA